MDSPTSGNDYLPTDLLPTEILGGKKPDGSCNHSWLYFLSGPNGFGIEKSYKFCVFCKKVEE